MKKFIFLILISFSFIIILHAETEKELFDKGVQLFKQGLYQKAVDEFSKLIKLAPDNADAYKNRGVSYMKLEKFDPAIKDFQTAKALFPELKGLYSNLGVAWYYKKEYGKAIQNYDIEIEMAPENHIAYFNRALCLAELDRNKEALEDLYRTLSIRPGFYWAICYKADLLARKGEESLAVETYEEAIRQEPKNAYAVKKLTELKHQIKNKESLESEKNKNPSPVTKDYTLQAGAFRNQANAVKMKTNLQDSGFDSRILTLKDTRDRTWYLVRSGRYTDRGEAKKALISLKDILAVVPIIRSVGSW